MPTNDVTFCITVLTTMLSEDPTKVIEAMEDAEFMIAMGAAMGTTKHELMAEYVVYIFKRMNPHLDDVIRIIEANEDEVEKGLIEYFDAEQH